MPSPDESFAARLARLRPGSSTLAQAIAIFGEPTRFCGMGGLSWGVPWLAGLYALAVQTDPDITLDQFLNAALSTGRIIEIPRDGRVYRLGTIPDPQALIEALRVR